MAYIMNRWMIEEERKEDGGWENYLGKTFATEDEAADYLRTTCDEVERGRDGHLTAVRESMSSTFRFRIVPVPPVAGPVLRYGRWSCGCVGFRIENEDGTLSPTQLITSACDRSSYEADYPCEFDRVDRSEDEIKVFEALPLQEMLDDMEKVSKYVTKGCRYDRLRELLK